MDIDKAIAFVINLTLFLNETDIDAIQNPLQGQPENNLENLK